MQMIGIQLHTVLLSSIVSERLSFRQIYLIIWDNSEVSNYSNKTMDKIKTIYLCILPVW